MILRHKIKKKEFLELWKKVEASNSGEPGIYFSNDADWGTNPCCEVALRPYQFCNLTTINVSNIESQEDLNNRARAAAFIGTLQASYTNFHYLRDIWKKTTERDALIGVSMTGIASGQVFKYNLEEAKKASVANLNKILSTIKGAEFKYTTTDVKIGKYQFFRIKVEGFNSNNQLVITQIYYNAYIQNHLFGVLITYNNEKEGNVMEANFVSSFE